jgi:hypothetical protein
VTQAVEHLLCKHKALNSNPSTAKTVNIVLPCAPAIPFQDLSSKEWKTGAQINTCAHECIGAVFTVAKKVETNQKATNGGVGK